MKDFFKKYLSEQEKNTMNDQIGALKGIFGYKQIDPKSGEVIKEVSLNNSLTNLSKTNIIRLLAQAPSKNEPNMNAQLVNNMKISKMRFGIGDGTPDKFKKFLYYKLNEEIRTNVERSVPRILTSEEVESGVVRRVYDIPAPSSGSVDPSVPPSQGTLRIDFLNGTTIVETLQFNDSSNGGQNWNDFVLPYNKGPVGSIPSKIISIGADRITTRPGDQAAQPIWEAGENTGVSGLGSRLIFNNQTNVWQFISIENSEMGSYSNVRFSYETGKFNILNSIVPQVGINSGSGTTLISRFNNEQDFYEIGSNVTFQDCAVDLIDDYSVQFSVTMTANLGNGNGLVAYTKAYLFDNNDKLFSVIDLPDAAKFEKTNQTAYSITWTILSPL